MDATQPAQVPPQVPAPNPVQPVTPTPATTEVQMPTEHTTQQAPQSLGKGPSLVLAVVGLIIFLLVGTVALAAANVGRGNVFSKLAAIIPVEKIPLLNALGKSDEELVRDLLPTTANYALSRQYGGEWLSSIAVFGGATTPDQQKIGIDLHFTGKTAASANMEKMKGEYTLGGNVSSGVVKFDLGESGVKYDMLMPNPNDMFFSIALSDQVNDTIAPYLQAYAPQVQAVTGGAVDVNDFFNTYWKIDMDEYLKLMEEQMGEEATSDYDYQKYQRAFEQLAKDIGPELNKVYSSTLGNIPRWATVEDHGRENVNGKVARVVGVQVVNDSVPPVALEFAEGMIEVIKTNPEAFRTFCTEISTTDEQREECDEDFSQERLDDLTMTQEDKDEFQSGMRDILEMITFRDVRFYISPVDNTLLKYQATIEASQNARNSMADSGMTWEKFGVTLSGEELNRRADIDVQAPAEYKDFVQVMRQMMESQQQMMQGYGDTTMFGNPTGTTSMPAYTNPYMTDPAAQEMFDDPAFQDYMMQQYGY